MNREQLIQQLMAYPDAVTMKETMEQWLGERGYDVIAREVDELSPPPFRTAEFPPDYEPCVCGFVTQPHGHDPVTSETIFFMNLGRENDGA